MTTKLISLFALCALLGTVMLACGGAADNANTTNAAAGNANAKAAATPAGTTAAAGDKIGVAECDDFLAKYEACVNSKVPSAMQATFKAPLDDWRGTWKKQAQTPQARAALTQACKSALENAKTSLGAFGCAW
jgi:hypothetical protein